MEINNCTVVTLTQVVKKCHTALKMMKSWIHFLLLEQIKLKKLKLIPLNCLKDRKLKMNLISNSKLIISKTLTILITIR